MIPGRTVEIGGLPVLLRMEDRALQEAVEKWYAGYLTTTPSAEPFDLTVTVGLTGGGAADHQAHVEWRDGRWLFERFDFQAEWFPDSGRGWVRQEGAVHQPIDSVLRILHSILVASQGGCLMHAASAVRNGRAFAFTGVSGAGKTTLSRLAPPDVALLTDEISYIRSMDGIYRAFGTPFAGDLGIAGDNISAPLKALYLLAKGPENRIEPLSPKQAVNVVMRNILFFAKDPKLVEALFETACRMAACIPVYRLIFTPTPAVWETIGLACCT
jgi:hypothetical protein